MDEAQLADLVMRDADFANLERVLDVFCPFEAVGMVRQEIRHAHFLAYFLDPNRPHGLGDGCLRAFLTAAVEAHGDAGASKLGVLDLHLMDLQSATVRREWRRIDLLIEIPTQRFALAVELKIDATEGNGQLAKYQDTLRKEHPDWTLLYAFLTKSGEDASDEQADTWAAMGLDAVEKALRVVVGRQGGSSTAGTMLLAYLEMLRRHHLTDDRLEQLAADLWKRHREALQFLADRQPNALSDAMSRMIKMKVEIAKQISKETGLNVVFDSESGTSHLRFAVEDWDLVEGLKGKSTWTASQRFILLELSRNSNNVKAYVQLGRGDKETRDSIYNRLKAGRAPIKNPGRYLTEWKRLQSQTLIRVRDDDDQDADVLFDTMRKELVKMAQKSLVDFDRVLRIGAKT